MFSRHLIAACGFTTFIGMLFCLPLAAIAQTSVLQASDSPTVPFRGSDSGLSVRNPAIIDQPVQLSEAVWRSLSERPAMQAGRACTCQALYRLGLNRAEARPQISGSITGQRQLFGHYKVSNNTDKDSAEARGVSDRELNVYDIEVSLRHKLWDWHVTDNRIRSEQLSHEAEQLNLDLNLSEQLLQLLTLSIRIHLFTEVVHLNHQTVQDLTPHIEAIEAQGEAGFVRLADVRRARLLLLDAEIALKEAENNLRQSKEELQTRFRLSEEEALLLLDQFLAARPNALLSKAIETLKSVQAIELQVRRSVHDIEAIDAELLPVLHLNIDSTIFDVADFESEYEVLGRLSLSMPLYDGGSNKARLSEASWRPRTRRHPIQKRK
ncbi:MAG: TolC family protein [Candidatus Puniceispirillaceae bacterium]